ncbi:hypothetical protein Dda_9274 [Drechslerella dactyloides]|uniref:Uncharacterized protein n=1 Tax=Drechslerella dactyloides TaxID=74499 RepID=A0AAD6IPP7_DREDA|nr:hypothetical protein Dda_9274 [Drechslerella dactyloides]
MANLAPLIQIWKDDVRPNREMSPRVLADWFSKAVDYFMDGDIDARCKVFEVLSSPRVLQQLKSCLSPNFLAQRWAPAINYHDHIIPILKMLSDPIIRTHPPTMAYAKIIYAVVMDVSNRAFWAKVSDMLDEAFRLAPFQIGPQMSGMMMIFMNSIEFDSKNLGNPIIQDALPRMKAHLEKLKARQFEGDLNPTMVSSFKILEQKTRGPMRSAGSQTEQLPGQLRALEISRQFEMQEYLRTIDARFRRGDLVSEIGFLGDEQEREHERDAAEDNSSESPDDGKEPELASEERRGFKAQFDHVDEIQAMDPYGLFQTKRGKSEPKPMIFTIEDGDYLLDQWLERGKDPEEMNMDWGKSADIKSMKWFLQMTLTLFNGATTETRLQFLSKYYLKEPYIGKFRECLRVKLPTNGINHPSPKYNDHVSPTIHIMSHDDVAQREEFQGVRAQMSKMMAAQPDFLYGIEGYLRTHLMHKAITQDMLARATKDIIVILEGVFKLVDGDDISVEFRHEAKTFLKFAWELEQRKLPSERTCALMFEKIAQSISAHAKLFPVPREFIGCRSRQEIEARNSQAGSSRDPTVNEMDKELRTRAREGKLIRPLGDFLGKGRRRADDEESWGDGEPIVHRVSWRPEGKEKEPKQENKEPTKPMNSEQALKYLEDCKAMESRLGCASAAEDAKKELKVGSQLPQKASQTGEAAGAVEPAPGSVACSGTPVSGSGSVGTGSPRETKPPGKTRDGERRPRVGQPIVFGPRPNDRRTREYYAQGQRAQPVAAPERQVEATEPPAPTSSRLVLWRRPRLETSASASASIGTAEQLAAGEGAEPPSHAAALPAATTTAVPRLPQRLPPLPPSQRPQAERMMPLPRAFPAMGTLTCGHPRYLQYDETNCPELVNKVTPVCGHVALVECSNKMRHWRCWARCSKLLPCGHDCGHCCSECLQEVKVDGTPVWVHLACRECKKLRYLEQKEMEKAEKAAGGSGGQA